MTSNYELRGLAEDGGLEDRALSVRRFEDIVEQTYSAARDLPPTAGRRTGKPRGSGGGAAPGGCLRWPRATGLGALMLAYLA